MQIRFFVIFILLLLCLTGLKGQKAQSLTDSVFSGRDELYVYIHRNSLKKSYYSKSPSRGGAQGDSLFFYLYRGDSIFLKEHIRELRFLTPPSMRRKIRMSNEMDEVLNGIAYPTYPLYLQMMEYFRDNFGDVCQIDTIGVSIEGRLLLAANISRKKTEKGSIPSALFTSSMHGDELTGYPLMLMLINYLLESDDPRVRELTEKLKLYIHPLENPDGSYRYADTSVFGATRGNANGVDLNRNYPDAEKGLNPDGNTTQKETLAMMDYLDRIRPSLSANFHGGTEVVNYPFDMWPDRHADNEWFELISAEYANLASQGFAGYMEGFNNGITNGYEWYEVNGGRQDYVTWFLRGREVTIELSTIKLLPESEILKHWNANRDPMVNYLRQAMYGIHGQVRDSINHKPLKAEISIPGHDRLNSSVFSDSLTGYFFRFLKEGNYNLLISAEGYLPARIYDLSINDYEKRELSVSLLPVNFISASSDFNLKPNPFFQSTVLEAVLNRPNELIMQISDLQGKIVHTSKEHFQAGFYDIEIDFPWPAGIYLLHICYGDDRRVLKMLKYD